jgi:UDP-glucose 4-epimerase
MSRIAVVGANGFIGKHLTKHLLSSGHEVLEFTSQNPILLGNSLSREFSNDIDDVIWLATKVNPVSAVVTSKLFEDETKLFQESLLKIGKINNGKSPRVIFMSSGGCVYDEELEKHSEENSACGSNPYGKFKALQETVVRKSSQHFVILRPSNVYGEFQKLGKGQGVIPQWIDDAMNGKELNVYGKLNTARDYMYIGDLVRAVDAVCGSLVKNEIFNVGTGVPTSLGELIIGIEKLTQRKLVKVFYEDRLTDRKRSCLDITKISKAFNWKPEVDLESGISRILRNQYGY